MKARLEYCGNYIEITDFCHSVDDEKNGSPYNCSFDISVRSGAFSGIADGCEYDYHELQKFIYAPKKMLSFKRKEVTFAETGYGNTIEFSCDRTGHIIVSDDIQSGIGDHALKAGGTRCHLAGMICESPLHSGSVTFTYLFLFASVESAGGTRCHLVGMICESPLHSGSVTFIFFDVKFLLASQHKLKLPCYY